MATQPRKKKGCRRQAHGSLRVNDALVNRYAAEAGDEEIMDALAFAGDERAMALLSMWCDPAYRNYSPAKLCEKVGLKARDLLYLLRQASLGEAMIRTARYLPQIMEETATDALSREDLCYQCEGSGVVGEDKRRCPVCFGKGSVRIPGDHKARQHVLRVAGLLGGRRASMQQQVNVNFAAVAPMESFMRLAGRILDGPVQVNAEARDSQERHEHGSSLLLKPPDNEASYGARQMTLPSLPNSLAVGIPLVEGRWARLEKKDP